MTIGEFLKKFERKVKAKKVKWQATVKIRAQLAVGASTALWPMCPIEFVVGRRNYLIGAEKLGLTMAQTRAIADAADFADSEASKRLRIQLIKIIKPYLVALLLVMLTSADLWAVPASCKCFTENGFWSCTCPDGWILEPTPALTCVPTVPIVRIKPGYDHPLLVAPGETGTFLLAIKNRDQAGCPAHTFEIGAAAAYGAGTGAIEAVQDATLTIEPRETKYTRVYITVVPESEVGPAIVVSPYVRRTDESRLYGQAVGRIVVVEP